MPITTFADPSDSDDGEIDRLREIIDEYDSCEDPQLKSDFLEAHGMTYPVIARFRKLVEKADRRRSSASETYTVHISASSRRRVRHVRRAETTPVSHPGGTRRPGGPSARNRRPVERVTLIIIVDFP